MADTDPKDEPKEGEGESDLDKLRSEKDTEIAAVTKSRDDLQAQIDTLNTALKSGQQSSADLAELQTQLDKIVLDPEAPEKAVVALRALVLEKGQSFVSERLEGARIAGLYKDALAKYHAVTIAQEHGGDWRTYHRELMASTTDTMLAANASILSQKVGLEKAKRSNGADANKGQQFRVDDGRGSPVRTDVQKAMESIDVTTPEGREEWAKREKEFAAAVKGS